MVTWGATEQTTGPASYLLTSWLFIRLLGLIYLAAFVSLATQVKGLIGNKGILPAAVFLETQRKGRTRRFCRVPTLCWLDSSDTGLMFLCWGGAALSLLLVLGIAPVPILILLWVFYLSLFSVGRIFLGYQWDILLLEIGFLAIFLAPVQLLHNFPPTAAPPPIIRWLLWWVLFRLMFSSGMVKLWSADPAWRKLTALSHHYETQPLPTPLAWHAHQLPLSFHKLSAIVMFVIELLVPFLIFAPPALRHLAALLFIVLMVLIQATGNYGFFNLLGMALSVLLLDDKFLEPAFQLLQLSLPSPIAMSPSFLNCFTMPVALLILLLSMAPMLRLFRFDLSWPKPITALFEFFDPFHLVNSYGLFSVMTTERPEIIIEGSADGVHWKAYDFKWKPGEAKRAPRFIAPHQPRLDWQMWFAALGYYPNNPWVGRFLLCLLEGSPAVLSLLAHNPFPHTPPRLIRATLFDYRFTDRMQRSLTGAWWNREPRGSYSPILRLEQPG